MQDTILQSIGWTPLIRLRRVAEGVPAHVFVKVEAQNPGGSGASGSSAGSGSVAQQARVTSTQSARHKPAENLDLGLAWPEAKRFSLIG